MNLTEFGIIYNLVGMLTLCLVSFIVSRRHPEPFFKDYVKAFFGGAGLMLLELSAALLGRTVLLNVLEVTLIAVTAGFFIQTGLRLHARGISRLRFVLAQLFLFAIAAMTLSAGAPIGVVMPLFSVPYALSFVWLGWQFIAFGRVAGSSAAGAWLGGPLMASGLWFLSFPLSLGSPHAWLGYLVSGILNMLVGTGMVVFVQEKTAARLLESNESLTRLNSLKTNFIRVMSHELRTPLSSINTATYLMTVGGQEPLTERQTELMAIVQDNTKLLHRFVSDILDFSRLESSALAFAHAEIDLVKLVRQAARSLAPEYAEKGVSLVELLPEAGVNLQADHDRLHQAVSNLLVNALKFTPAGGTVTMAIAADADSATIAVTDTGIGISADDCHHIFEKFYQADSSSTRQAGGLGLGLAIARAIVRDGHGGSLTVESQVGSGSTFTITLPRHQAPLYMPSPQLAV
jgi:signal transduction histidine kinase